MGLQKEGMHNDSETVEKSTEQKQAIEHPDDRITGLPDDLKGSETDGSSTAQNHEGSGPQEADRIIGLPDVLKECIRRVRETGGHDNLPEDLADVELGMAEEDSEVARAIQKSVMLEATVALSRHIAESKRTQSIARAIADKNRILSDPVWGEVKFGDEEPGVMDKLCFGCCPCCFGCCYLPVAGRDADVRQETRGHKPKQGWKRFLLSCSFNVSAAQLVVFAVVAATQGLVPFDKNHMIGPHPHSLDAAGAKNAARILYSHEWWRLLSACFLHGGVIHLLSNVFMQLQFGINLEVIWGTRRWLVVFAVSGLCSNIASCIFLPNGLGIGSSGAICGLIGADLVFVLVTWRQTLPKDISERNMLMAYLALSVAITTGVNFLPLVDFAAHAGGFVSGVLLGCILFAGKLQDSSTVVRMALRMVGCVGMLLLLAGSLFYLFYAVEPDKFMLDLCKPELCD